MSDADVIAQARWQGGVDAKLDAVLARMDAQAVEQTRSTQDLTGRVDSLESFRDRLLGLVLGASLGSGLVGGGIVSVISHIVGS